MGGEVVALGLDEVVLGGKGVEERLGWTWKVSRMLPDTMVVWVPWVDILVVDEFGVNVGIGSDLGQETPGTCESHVKVNCASAGVGFFDAS